MKAYLSIDLDFWSGMDSRKSQSFFKKVFSLKKPITFVIEHEEIICDINSDSFDVVYNFDYHSDLVDDGIFRTQKKPMDFCWANFIKHRNEYIWIMPCQGSYHLDTGFCHAEEENNPFEHKTTEWENVFHTTNIKTISWKDVERVGVCLSPIFVDLKSVKSVLKLFEVDYNEMDVLVRNQPWESRKRKRGILSVKDCLL